MGYADQDFQRRQSGRMTVSMAEEMAAAKAARRAEWIRNNVAKFQAAGYLNAIDVTEKLADELIARGYL